jgi:hypothetical protein
MTNDNNNNNIVFSDDDDEATYCDSCDALLAQRRDESMVCTNPECGRTYLPDSVQKHRSVFAPEKGYHSLDARQGPELVGMSQYGAETKKKKPSVFDREDRMMEARSGFSWIEHEDWPQE